MSAAVRKTTILIVEDDPNLRELYRRLLVTAGYAAIAVEDGLDALRLMERQVPSLVVLDLALPRLPGQDVARELRAQAATRHIPIVIVTGTDARDLTATDFPFVLRKPVEPDALLAAVDDGLRRARAQSLA